MGEEKPFEFLRTLFEGVIAGGPAGVVAETVLYLIDIIKTRLQFVEIVDDMEDISYYNLIEIICKIEGQAAFLKGIGPRVLWIGIDGSIFFGVLERTKLLLSQRHSKHLISESPKQE